MIGLEELQARKSHATSGQAFATNMKAAEKKIMARLSARGRLLLSTSLVNSKPELMGKRA